MISIGVRLNGPELSRSRIDQLLRATMRSLATVRGAWIGRDDFGPGDSIPPNGKYFEKGSAPAVNVVFDVPGSLGNTPGCRIEAGRFSRKQKLLLVTVPVPNEVVDSGGSVEFVVESLQQANQIAAKTFADKNAGEFDLGAAEEIVEAVKQSLVAQGF